MNMKIKFLFIISIVSIVLPQSRSIIYNNGDPISEEGHSIYWDGDVGSSASNKLSLSRYSQLNLAKLKISFDSLIESPTFLINLFP